MSNPQPPFAFWLSLIRYTKLTGEISRTSKNVVVVVTSGGGVDMNRWIDQVPGLIETWYPGQEGGTALAEILFGETNPSGHLPATFERNWEDNPAHDNYYPDAGTNRIVYKEGVFVGYRGYQKNQVKPLFPFGFGLSYTTIKYANLAIKPRAESSDPDYEVTFDVTNTGSVPGAAVAQLYVGQKHSSVPRPNKELKAFAKVFLKPGETRTVSLPLNARSFSYYDVSRKQWRAEAGAFGVLVGNSSQDIQLEGEMALGKEFLIK